MATTKPAFPGEVTEIQERMAQIRHQMHQEVQGAVKGAYSLTDWRSLVANHPWTSLGVAAAVGYLIVPRSAPAPQAVLSLHTSPEVAELSRAQSATAAAHRSRFKPLAALGNLLLPVVLRAAQNYALNHFEGWLAAHPPRPTRGSPEAGRTERGPQPDRSGFQGTVYRESR